MAAGNLLTEWAIAYEILNSGISFDNLVSALGKAPPGTFLTSNSTSFSSDQILFTFDELDIASFLATDPTLAYITLAIEYEVSNDTADDYTVSVQGNGYALYEFVSQQPQKENTTYTKNNDEGNRKLATFTFYLNNLIPNVALQDESFGFAVQFICSNPSGSNVTLSIYETSLYLKSATGAPYILFYDTSKGKFSELNSIADYNIIEKAVDTSIRVYNVGTEKLQINANGITLSDSTDVQFSSTPSSAEQSLLPNSYITVFLRLNGFTAGKSVSSQLRISSNAYNSTSGITTLYFIYTVSTPTTTVGTIQLSYADKVYATNSIINLATLPLSISSKTILALKNVGTTTLTVYNTTITGSGDKAEDCITNNSTIAVGQTKNFTFYPDTNTSGNRSSIVTIQSSDSANGNLIVTLVYSVAEQTKFVLYESASSQAVQTELVNDDLVDFGFVDKGRSLKKYYTITNSGVYKTLIINSITSTVDDIVVGTLPSFPYTLQKNSANSLTFDVTFLTSASGLKTGSLLIDYDEGAI